MKIVHNPGKVQSKTKQAAFERVIYAKLNT